MSAPFDMGGWEDQPQGKTENGRLEWLRIAPDTTKVLRLLDATPKLARIHHLGSTPVPCRGERCKWCQQDNLAQPYKCLRVLDREDTRIKGYRMPLKVAGIMREQVLEKHGDPTRYDIAVTRTGGSKATRYSFTKVGAETPVDLNGQRVPEWDEIFPPPKKNESEESEQKDETGNGDSDME